MGDGGGGGVKSFSCQTQLLSWVLVKLGLWQYYFTPDWAMDPNFQICVAKENW